jgi:hypothetical protein
VDIRIPMKLRAEPVDKEHPNRVSILYGPVVLVEDLRFNRGLQMPAGVTLLKIWRRDFSEDELKTRAGSTAPGAL